MKRMIRGIVALLLTASLLGCAVNGEKDKESEKETEGGTVPVTEAEKIDPPETVPPFPYENLYLIGPETTGWVNGSGQESPDGSFYTSDYIEALDGEVFTFGPAVTSQGWHLVLYDENKNVICDGTVSNGIRILENADDTVSVMQYIVSKANAAYIRFVSDRRYHDHYLVTRDDPFDAADLAEYAGLTVKEAETFAREANSPLEGLHVLFLGDSLCAGQWDDERVRAWSGRIAEQFGTVSDNRSVGGYCFSDIRGTGPMILNQLNAVKSKNYDMVILEGGVNDAWGTVDGSDRVAPVGTITDSFDVKDFDVSTFAGGMEKTLYYIDSYFPGATVGYIAVFNMKAADGIGKVTEMDPYYDMAEQICEKWGIGYLDMYHDDYVNDELMAVTTNRYLRDPVHPNKEGYDRLSPYIGKWMETLVS